MKFCFIFFSFAIFFLSLRGKNNQSTNQRKLTKFTNYVGDVKTINGYESDYEK